MSETVISIKDLSKSFGDHEVLRKIDIDVHSGEVICIVGSSGSGKSTLLRCINKLEKQTSGKILYHDKEVRNVQKDINDYRSKVGNGVPVLQFVQQYDSAPELYALYKKGASSAKAGGL